MPQYWVVGAMWDGVEDQFEVFVRRGRWHLGWKDADSRRQAAKRDRIEAGDRIAIKRMLGAASRNIEIRALGVVTKVDKQKHVHVRWAVSDLGRRVPARGCFGSIHGPYAQDDEWTRKVFQL